MSRSIPRQYWQFYTAERLARRDIDYICTDGTSYLHALRDLAMRRNQEFLDAKAAMDSIANQVFIEASATTIAGGLELKLTFDDNGELPYETLLPYASLGTQRKFVEAREYAQKLFDITQYLVDYYNQTRKDWVQRMQERGLT